MIRAGACCIDITPPAGMAMAGFAARTQPSSGMHDALSVRAVTVNDTALVVADVIGLHEDMSARIRSRCCLPDAHVVVAAMHTHGGPVTMAGRAGGGAEAAYLARLEGACVAAIDRAAAGAVPATIAAGMGGDPGVARNRRHAEGPLDRALPVMRISALDGAPLVVITSYACHPVVLGPDNRLWTADYPHIVRQRLEASFPGAMALFATGCAGDANTGHSAHASLNTAANPARSFVTAARLGDKIADAALGAPLRPRIGAVCARQAELLLHFERRESMPPHDLARLWREERASAPPMRALILDQWIKWAQTIAIQQPEPWLARVSMLDWGGVRIVALPGEIFAETALAIRARFGDGPAFVIGYAEGNPGYIPPASEFAHGGYEVDEAHRYYGLPATFAPGSAELLAHATASLG